MRVELEHGPVIDVRFHKKHRSIEKGRFKGRVVVDTACIVSEVVGQEAGKSTFEQISSDVALHCPKDKYNKYRGKQISLTRALYKSNIPGKDTCVVLNQFEKEFAHCK